MMKIRMRMLPDKGFVFPLGHPASISIIYQPGIIIITTDSSGWNYHKHHHLNHHNCIIEETKIPHIEFQYFRQIMYKEEETWDEANCALQTPQAPLGSFLPLPFNWNFSRVSFQGITWSLKYHCKSQTILILIFIMQNISLIMLFFPQKNP